MTVKDFSKSSSFRDSNQVVQIFTSQGNLENVKVKFTCNRFLNRKGKHLKKIFYGHANYKLCNG